MKSCNSSVAVVTRLTARLLTGLGLVPGRVRNFYLLQNIHTGCGVHAVSYSEGARDAFSEGGRGLNLAIHLHLMPG
jgi:hypothetical protein